MAMTDEQSGGGRKPVYRLNDALGFLLYRTHQHAATEFRRALEPVGLTPPQFAVLALLDAQSGQRQAALGERATCDPNTMVGIVDRLEAAGLVERQRDPHDRRAYVVEITTAGRRTFRNCVPRQKAAAKRSWVGLTATEQNQLRDLLQKALAGSQPGVANKGRGHG